MKIIAIAAVDLNYGIGKDNDLLCQLPADMKHFKETTIGYTVIMGRKTWDSIPAKYRPLPGRKNIVISRDQNLKIEGVEVANSIAAAILLCFDSEKVFIIGGGEIYKQFMEVGIVKELNLTSINYAFPEANVFFPDIPMKFWVRGDYTTHLKDEKNMYDYSFVTFTKKD